MSLNGLSQASKTGKIEIGYWAIRGLGAPLRMMASYGGLEWDDFQVKEPQEWFGTRKEDILKLNPLANLPFLIDGDVCVCQTNAVMLYLGDRCGLNGKTTAERLQTVQMLEEIYDLRNRVIELVYPFKEVCRDQAEHDAKLAAHLEKGAKGNYTKFEACVVGPFFLGAEVSTSDFHLFEMLDQHELMCAKAGAASLLADFPKLKALHEAMKAAPELAGYFASDACKLPCNNAIANCYFK